MLLSIVLLVSVFVKVQMLLEKVATKYEEYFLANYPLGKGLQVFALLHVTLNFLLMSHQFQLITPASCVCLVRYMWISDMYAV